MPMRSGTNGLDAARKLKIESAEDEIDAIDILKGQKTVSEWGKKINTIQGKRVKCILLSYMR